MTVIVPFYKNEKYAKKCIDSIINQKCDFSIEILLIDDGSPDNCGVICDEYAKTDNRIKVIHKENGGLSDARNTGLKAATGEYIFFLDSDDYIPENTFQVLLETAKKYNADIVEGGYTTFGNNRSTKKHLHKFELSTKGKDIFGFAWGKVFKTKLFEKFCFPNGFWFEDTIIGALIFPEANTTVTVPEETYFYFINSNGISLSSKTNPKCIDTYYIIEELYETLEYYSLNISNSLKSAVIWQLSKYIYNRCNGLKNEKTLKSLFVLCSELAYKYDVFSYENKTFWENEICEAFKNKQYYRWKTAAILM
ncbi:MAG: glycosyltransferase family 2 protein [Clostridia bacterium]|nr:glycosyltransferase family 2 protein [Clostridia bacterium]